MNSSRLIKVFQTFSPQEMKEFSEFVSSPFFNKNKNVIKLFEIIRKNYPDLNSEQLLKEKVFEKLFPGKEYNDSTLRLLMFYLFEVVEKFISYNRSQHEPLMHRNLFLSGDYLDRKLFKEFEKILKQTEKEIEDVSVKNETYYLNRFILDNQFMTYLSEANYDKYDKVMTKNNVEKVFNSLTYHYLIRVLKFYSVLLNTKLMFNTDAETIYFENILKNYNPGSFKEAPLIDIYYNVVMCLVKPTEPEFFYRLKNLVIDNINSIEKDTLGDLFINLENYCTRKMREGNDDFLKESFEIYKLELSLPEKIYMGRGFMSGLFYKNVVNTACRLKESQWTDNFIEQYKVELNDEDREPYYNYCKAFVLYVSGHFDDALTSLAKVKPDELYLKQEVKILQCSIYYDLGWLVPLGSLVDTFRRTVNDNKVIPEARKKHYLAFTKYIEKLCNVKSDPEKYPVEKVLADLNDAPYFPQKAWIKEKLLELGK